MGVLSVVLFLAAALAACSSRRIIADLGGKGSGASPHIVGGDEAHTNQFPELVSVQYDSSHYCGGTLIDTEWVLTAAHCVDGVDPSMLSVVGGTLTWADGGTRIEVDGYQIHDDYSPKDYLTHDVALIKLVSPMPLSDSIQIATLKHDPVKDGQPAIVAGWGMKDIEKAAASDTLQFVEVETLNYEKCQDAFGDFARVYENQICVAPSPGRGECKGDSGGPLFVDGMQVGVVSWSPKPCAATGFPGVFANVAKHIDWILSTVPYA